MTQNGFLAPVTWSDQNLPFLDLLLLMDTWFLFVLKKQNNKKMKEKTFIGENLRCRSQWWCQLCDGWMNEWTNDWVSADDDSGGKFSPCHACMIPLRIVVRHDPKLQRAREWGNTGATFVRAFHVIFVDDYSDVIYAGEIIAHWSLKTNTCASYLCVYSWIIQIRVNKSCYLTYL